MGSLEFWVEDVDQEVAVLETDHIALLWWLGGEMMQTRLEEKSQSDAISGTRDQMILARIYLWGRLHKLRLATTLCIRLSV